MGLPIAQVNLNNLISFNDFSPTLKGEIIE